MGLEVANLKATINFAAKGADEATRAAASVDRAVKALGTTIDEAGSKTGLLEANLRSTTTALDAAQAKFDAAQDSVVNYTEKLAALDEKYKTIAKGIESRTIEFRDAQARIAAVNDEIAAFGSLEDRQKAAASAERELEAALNKTVISQERLAAATNAGGGIFYNNTLDEGDDPFSDQ